MTQTRSWLERRRRQFVRLVGGSGVLRTTGLVFMALAVGLLFARLGLYRWLPAAALVGWGLAAGAVALGVWRWRVGRRAVDLPSLASTIEAFGQRRAGSIRSLAEWHPTSGLSDALARAADTKTTVWLDGHGDASLRAARQGLTGSLAMSVAMLVAGAVVFLVAGPTAPASATFWKPLSELARSRMPVTLTVDRARVRRGDVVVATVSAPGRREASLWTRAPGQPWQAVPVALDTAGRASLDIGPLDADRFLQARARGGESDIVAIEVALPALLAQLDLRARFPDYIGRADEPLATGDDPMPLPVGTEVWTDGQATVELRDVSWVADGRPQPVSVRERSFAGSFRVVRDARYELRVLTRSGAGLDEEPPVLDIVAVPDLAPTVAVPVPGADTTAPLSLRQPLLVDARDDYGLTRLDVVSWRVNRFGERGSDVITELPLTDDTPDRSFLSAVLDLNDRGFLPGDTAYFKVRAFDNAPSRQLGESEVFALVLPSLSTLRREVRQEARALGDLADSLAARQEALARELADLASERQRGAEDQLPFESVEQARELLDAQENTVEDAAALERAIKELQDAAWSAGITDPEFHRQLRDLQRLLDNALSDELTQRLNELRQSLDRLDPTDVREALKNLADAAQRLREELERNRELYERAALEGQMSTLAQDADELARQQEEWNRAADAGADSTLAAREERLAEQVDSLAAALDELRAAVDSLGGSVDQARQQAGEASTAMRQAAGQAQQGEKEQAQQSGQAASESLDPMSQELRQQRDQMREAWRQEVAAAMSAALSETASLAGQQEQIEATLRGGETGGEVRGQQAAVREGLDRVMERVQDAAGKNALVSPRLGTTLGLSRLRMSQALEQLQRPQPSGREAADAAGQALDALNATIYALLHTQGQVEGAESGSGLEEAMEQLAKLAEQQGAMNGETGNMMTMAEMGNLLMQQLQGMAQRERSLAQELERLEAGGEVGGAEQMAEEAREIARDLEAGRLDRELAERQERLFRRLLDAGRTLRNDQEDEREERVSETARSGNVRAPGASELLTAEPRYRVPTWDELRGLSPDTRRLIVDYFRRLNERRP